MAIFNGKKVQLNANLSGGGGGDVVPDLVIRATYAGGDVSEEDEDYTYTIESGSVAAVCEKIRAEQKPLVIVKAASHVGSLFKTTIVEATVSAYLYSRNPQWEHIDICWLRVFNEQGALERAKFFTTTFNRVT